MDTAGRSLFARAAVGGGREEPERRLVRTESLAAPLALPVNAVPVRHDCVRVCLFELS